ncbi:four-carbon acid sugar kinase family protein [Globicatella sanguinis]
MLKLLVIADDFTGALDTGVQFAKLGIETIVSTDINIKEKDITDEAEILVINSETRHLSAREAYQSVKIILEKAKQLQIPYIYKKVDSALRGNVSSEIKALVELYPDKLIPFLPSYPDMNRYVLNGNLYIDDVLVTESVFAQDPYEPVRESNIIKRLKTEANIEAKLVNSHPLPTKGVAVFDAKTNKELQHFGELLNKNKNLNIYVGCAGFAKILAELIFESEEKEKVNIKKPLVVICGSVNPITQKQVRYINKDNPVISLNTKQLLTQNYWETSEGNLQIHEFSQLINSNRIVVFETFSQEAISHYDNDDELSKVSDDAIRFKIADSLGVLTKKLWEFDQKGTFLFTGGDTLYQSMKVLGVTQLKPMNELASGVVLSNLLWNNQEMMVITKSGGFGEEELFEQIINKEY